MTVLTWPSVCGNESVFWDSNMIWNTTEPNISECFEKTVFVWFPFGLLWILIPVEIHYVSKSSRHFIPLSLISTTKMIANIILVLLSIVEFSNVLYLHSQGQTILALDIYNPVIKAMTFLLCIVFVHMERIQGIQSSGVMFAFWLTLSVTAISSYCTWITRSLDQNSCPRVRSPILSKLFFCWLNSIGKINNVVRVVTSWIAILIRDSVYRMASVARAHHIILLCNGYKKQLSSRDVWNSDSAVVCPSMVPVFYAKHNDEKRPSLQKILYLSHWGDVLTASILMLLSSIASYVIPYLFSHFIQFVVNEEPFWHGWLYIALMVLVIFCSSFLHWHAQALASTTGTANQSALSLIIYQKVLTLPVAHLMSVPELFRLVDVDSMRMANGLKAHVDWVTFLAHIGLGTWMLYLHLGMAAFVGIGVVIILEIVTLFLVFQFRKLKMTLSKYHADGKNTVDETARKIKMIKLLAWEKAFIDRMQRLRAKHWWLSWTCNYLGSVLGMMATLSTYMAVFATLAFHGLYIKGTTPNPAEVFVAIIILTIMRGPLNCLPDMLDRSAEAVAAASRLKDFLMTTSQNLHTNTFPDSSTGNSVEMSDASFSWDIKAPQKIALKNLKFTILEKSLTVITGPAGSGKSSLLAAILGEMIQISGSSVTKGSMAFVSSTPWMQSSATIRDNITFGKPYDKTTYDKILQECHLEEDLSRLPLGDATVVTNTGSNLCWKLQQKINLGRAVYSNLDIYLLDDIWRASDIHNYERQLFDNVVGPRGLLDGKTRVVVTSDVEHLPTATTVFLLEHGTILEMGPYDELMRQNNALFDFLADLGPNPPKSKQPSFSMLRPPVVGDGERLCRDDDDGTESQMRQLSTERVRFSTHSLYWKFFGIRFGTLVVVLVILATCSFLGILLWPITWHETTDSRAAPTQIAVLGCWILAYGTMLFLGSLATIGGTAKASKAILHALFYRLLRSSLSGFKNIPLQETGPRYAKYAKIVDTLVLRHLEDLCHKSMEIAAAVIVICISVPIFTTVMVPITLIYILIQRYYVATVGQLRHLRSQTKSPICDHFMETVLGGPILRVFGRQRAFANEFARKLDSNLKHDYYAKIILSWTGVRLDILTNVLVFLAAMMGMIYVETLKPAVTAAIITCALIVHFQLVSLVNSCGHLHGNMVLMKALEDFWRRLPREASWNEPANAPDPEWPERGSITYRKYFVKDRSDAMQPIVANFTCAINGGEKIGVCGLTEGEKGLLAGSLYRLVEPCGGSMAIDGLDISRMGLHDLRSRLTTISQEPSVFSGTVRFNLDPFHAKPDEEIWKVLDVTGLKELISSLPNHLSFEIDPSGKNLRILQPYIDEKMSLARAILHKTMIIIIMMDKLQADLNLQDLIRQEFANCTIILIADSPIPMMDLNRVMVLDKGQILEYDNPQKLLQDPESLFFRKSHDETNQAVASV